ncbi:1-(5-phosphoribosyl)-5-[(5-phosphoribosylamino)methylideneamino]imidazole-4-carboxamide isomerase [Candidatus Oscillochloris fontis]|uniref:1-(5-phosphoribosyl)-5-[(5- phosphoribosylamino)methylideneamino]imidazole-4- carboxamide isomerase n=1 Tax=Candidatus Oscillochloris fontis TaxID=2496868 RepID=UPI00101C6EC6|nr:1-(5-phosphoribosyl)-5-[(5-phosphoribosylamino)methylideneamino]imidazole-4-carboxamide isomerase [Candidatus Oscillochloris fontis]
MQIIPAIDLKDGRCVRLYQGDFAQATVYGEDPVAMAQRWASLGAPRLHLVDLDGAKQGHPVNTPAIHAIVAALKIPVQLGGGLRTAEDIRATLDLGVARVVLGTAAVAQADLVAQMVAEFGERIIVGVDARDGLVATDGWLTTANVRATDLIDQMAQLGVQRIIYTDISRDGTMTEPNFAAISELLRPTGPAIIASGGIATLDHLKRLAELGVEGAIVGKALYTGAIDLAQALT